MEEYLKLMEDIIEDGANKTDRTGTGTYSLFGQVMKFDLTDGKLPLLTTKKMYYNSLIHELLWFISGSTDIEYLKKNNVSIWDLWIIPGTERYAHAGKLVGGSIGIGAYGAMWRKWEDTRIIPSDELMKYRARGYEFLLHMPNAHPSKDLVHRDIDQLGNAIEMLKNAPDGRRIIVSAWNPGRLEDAALPPCHSLYQFWTRKMRIDEMRRLIVKHALTNEFDLVWGEELETRPDTKLSEFLTKFLTEKGIKTRYLSCMLYQRSCDVPVGVPFNFSQYALLTILVAQVVNMEPEELIHILGDAHVYQPQLKLAQEQLSREVYPQTSYVKLNPDIKNIDDFKFEDIEICGYNRYHPAIKYPVAV